MFSKSLVAVDIVVLVMAIGNVNGAARFVFGLLFALIVPGWSIIGLIRLRDGGLEVGLTLATSLAALMISAQLLMSIGLWHLVGFEVLTCLLCLPSLIRQSFSWHNLPGEHSK